MHHVCNKQCKTQFASLEFKGNDKSIQNVSKTFERQQPVLFFYRIAL